MGTWTDAEKHFLRINWSNMIASGIANKLGKTTSSVRGKAKVMGLPPKKGWELSKQLEDYGPSPETLEEIKARKRMKELLEIQNSFNIKERVRIKSVETITKPVERIFEGLIVGKTDRFITIQNGQYPVSFAYILCLECVVVKRVKEAHQEQPVCMDSS